MAIKELWIGGYPSYFGGADTEILHLIDLWRRYDVDVNLVPMFGCDPKMRINMDALGVKTHEYRPDIFKDKVVGSWCNGEFLRLLPEIMERGKPKCVVWHNCVPADSIISGPSMKMAKDIQIGDLVYGHDGKLHKILNCVKNDGKKTMINMSVVGLPNVQVTSEHKVLVYEKRGKVLPENKNYIDIPIWKKAKDVVVGDYLIVPKLRSNHIATPVFPINNHHNTKHRPKLTNTKEVAWLMGIFAADGCAELDHRVSICLSKKDHVDKAISAFRQLGVIPKLSIKEKYTIVNANSSVLGNTFYQWFGSGSENKTLPAFLLNGEWDYNSILDGLIDGDGCYTRNEVRFSTVSRNLMLQIFHIAITCGYRPTIYEQKRSKGVYGNNKPLFVVRWIKNPQKIWQTRWHNNYYCLPVRNIVSHQWKDSVYDFEVEDAHSFLVNGIVAHNCMTWCFDDEKKAHKNGWIDYFGFVSNYQKGWLKPELEKIAPVNELVGYRPYFNVNNISQQIEFNYRPPDKWFAIGRISRDDGSKYSEDMWNIFYKVCTPIHKKVFILGYGHNSHIKTGSAPGALHPNAPEILNLKKLSNNAQIAQELNAVLKLQGNWLKGLDWQAWLPNEVPVKQVYSLLHCIIHKTGGSRESYCRIVPEAYAYGVPIITEDDFAFPDLIVDGVTGYRCKTSDEMSFRASELAFDEEKRKKMIFAAREYLLNEIASTERCFASWAKMFKEQGMG